MEIVFAVIIGLALGALLGRWVAQRAGSPPTQRRSPGSRPRRSSRSLKRAERLKSQRAKRPFV